MVFYSKSLVAMRKFYSLSFFIILLFLQANMHLQAQKLPNNLNSRVGEDIEVNTPAWIADSGNGTFTNPLFYEEFIDPDMITKNLLILI